MRICMHFDLEQCVGQAECPAEFRVAVKSVVKEQSIV